MIIGARFVQFLNKNPYVTNGTLVTAITGFNKEQNCMDPQETFYLTRLKEKRL